jgi:hypothetical protein
MSTKKQQLIDNLNTSLTPPMLSCPALPPQMDLISTAPAINSMGKALGVTTCTTQDNKYNKNSSSSSLFSSSNSSVNINNKSTIGCEPIAILSQTYQNAQNNISCIINNAQSTMSVKSVAINSIILDGSGLNCGIININQKSAIDIKTSLTFTNEDTVNITNQVINVANAASNIVENIITTTPQIPDSTGPLGAGGKAASNIQKLISTSNFKQHVNNAITKMDLGTQVGNNLVFKNSTLTASVCNIDQYIQVNIIASSILANSLKIDGADLFDKTKAAIATIKGNAAPIQEPTQAPKSNLNLYYIFIPLTVLFLIILIVVLIKYLRSTPTTKTAAQTTKTTAQTTKTTAQTTKATAQTTKATAQSTKATAPTTKAAAPTIRATAPTIRATVPTIRATVPIRATPMAT